MPITILCPKGHKLTCPDSLAGKAGKCPHCGEKFRIPEKSGVSSAAPAAGSKAGSGVAVGKQSIVAEAAGDDVAAGATATATVAPGSSAIRSLDGSNVIQPRSDEIVFMCPEGHHLCGPSGLVDQPGECPVCHERFIVPSPDEVVEPQEPELALTELLATAEAPQGFSFNGDSSGPRGLGALFAELWKYRALGSAVELMLGEGRVLVPSGFAAESAGLSHGIFTVAEPNGATTLTVIAWSSIERVNVRGLYSLPRGVEFDIPQ